MCVNDDNFFYSYHHSFCIGKFQTIHEWLITLYPVIPNLNMMVFFAQELFLKYHLLIRYKILLTFVASLSRTKVN